MQYWGQKNILVDSTWLEMLCVETGLSQDILEEHDRVTVQSTHAQQCKPFW